MESIETRNVNCEENGIEGEYMFPPWIQTLNIRSFCLTCGVYINHFSIRLVFVIIWKLIKKTNLHKVMQLHINYIWDSMCSCPHSSYINFSMRVKDVSVVLYMPAVHP